MPKAFEGRSLFFWIIISTALVGVLGILDYQTGNEFSFSLFYLLPILLISWYVGRAAGLGISVFSALTWLSADIFVREDYFHPIVYFWNTLMRFGFFVIVAYLVSELNKSQKIVEALAHTDFITGVVNSRYFHQLLSAELARARRYERPFTLIYLDIDNFKQVNDRFGHEGGDILIKAIADELNRNVRVTDTVARLGGDEFAILFPETGQQEAKIITTKLHEGLKERLNPGLPFITFSAGVVTYLTLPASVTETIKIADKLMYSVKNSTKDSIHYSTYTGERGMNR